MPKAKITNLEKFEAAGMVDPKHKFSPEEQAAIEGLSADELRNGAEKLLPVGALRCGLDE